MLSFYMDHHVHGSITVGLRRRGIDVVTAFEDGREEADDEPLPHAQSSVKRPVLSPTRSAGTPARSSNVSNRFAIGVRSGYRRCCPPLHVPQPPPATTRGSGK